MGPKISHIAIKLKKNQEHKVAVKLEVLFSYPALALVPF
jgi:hypothetical protein